MSALVGQPMDRVDGRAKVTGTARYSGEFTPPKVAYAVTFQSTIAKGSIRTLDVRAAESAPGVLVVITHQNAMSLSSPKAGGDARLGERNLLPLQSGKIFYDGQHIGLVVAETFEQAEHAVSLVAVTYNEDKPVFEIEPAAGTAYQPKSFFGNELQTSRGDVKKGMQNAAATLTETYSTPVYHHNPMEPHATVAVWNGDELTLYDSTQGVFGQRAAVAAMLGIAPARLHLICPFVGGGFGCKGFTWAHSVLAPMAAKKVGRPVKLVLTRRQMFTCNGHRARTIQKISLAAAKNGQLQAISHDTTTETSFVDEFVEPAGVVTKMLYACPNVSIAHHLVKLNKGTPTPTRAPGEAVGTFALESAMDELAYQLKMDPVGLRLACYAEKHPEDGKAWSGKHLKECYERGVKAIGWAQRNPEPRSMTENGLLVGYGMATATYPANREPASAKVQIFPDGRIIAGSGTQDIGTGTYTIMTQIAADALGVPAGAVEFQLGDTRLPEGPVSGGSQTAASVGPAVRAAALAVRRKIIQLALADQDSPFHGLQEGDIVAENGRLFLPASPEKFETYYHILQHHKLPVMEAESHVDVSTRPGKMKQKNSPPGGTSPDPVLQDEEMDREDYAFHSFGAHFMKVLVHPELGTVRLAEAVIVMDIGRVLNLKMARNQLMGGMIFGLGMALMEGTVYDPANGRVVTRDLASYLVPVQADIQRIDVQFLDKPDVVISPLGARGIGEIGITGSAAALANAVYHATGRRIRDLPITPDKLI